MNAYPQERISDVVRELIREEVPKRAIYGLIAASLALFFCVVFVLVNVYQSQQRQQRIADERAETQGVWNATLKGQLEGLKATIEFGPRITALEKGQDRQLAIIAAIAEKLGIKEIPEHERDAKREENPRRDNEGANH